MGLRSNGIKRKLPMASHLQQIDSVLLFHTFTREKLRLEREVAMACPAQSMLSASSCMFLRSSKPAQAQAALLRCGGGGGRQFLVTCNASSSSPPSSPPAPAPAPPQEESDCNEEECAPEKEVGSVSAEWLAEERTKVVGTFPPKKRGWTGLVEKDTAGQTNIYSVEPTVYVAESAISSGAAGTSAEGSESTVAVTAGIGLLSAAAAAAVLVLVNKNQASAPQVQAQAYDGPPLSYYVAKFQSGSGSGQAPAAAAAAPPTVDAPADAEQLPS